MTDSERSYVTDEDYSRIMNETGKYWRPGGPGERGSHLTCERNIRRLLNEMIEREVRKAQTEATIHTIDLTINCQELLRIPGWRWKEAESDV